MVNLLGMDISKIMGGISSQFEKLVGGGDPFPQANVGGGDPFGGARMGGGNPFGGASMGNSNPFGAASMGNSNPFGAMGGGGGDPFPRAQIGGRDPFGSFGMSGNDPFGSFNMGNSDPFGSVGLGGDPWAGGIRTQPFASEDTGTKARPTSQSQAGGSGFLGAGTGSDNATLTGAKVNEFIASTRANSPLAGMGDFILREAAAKGVSVPQLLGIMTLESGLGTEQGTLPGVYNYGGLTGSGYGGQTGNTTGMAREFATFATKEDGIRALIANLATDKYRGKSIQQQTSMWYLGKENAGLDETDEKGNAKMSEYLNVIGGVFRSLGVGYDPAAAPQKTATGGTPNAAKAIELGRTFTGVDYTFGGIRNSGNPRDGMDCSSFTGYILGLDRNLWNAQTQYDSTTRVEKGQMQEGDLIFFADPAVAANDPSAKPVTHVGIYVGNGQMMHTGTPGTGVTTVSLDDPYYQRYWHGAGRVK